MSDKVTTVTLLRMRAEGLAGMFLFLCFNNRNKSLSQVFFSTLEYNFLTFNGASCHECFFYVLEKTCSESVARQGLRLSIFFQSSIYELTMQYIVSATKTLSAPSV